MSLNARQQKAVAALISQPTRKAAAEAAGIGERTLRTYLADGEFREAYRKAAQDAFGDATRRARQSLTLALDTLTAIAADGEASDTARISASRALLEYGVKMTELNDVIHVLREIEGGC